MSASETPDQARNMISNLNKYVDLVTQNEKYRITLLTDLVISASSVVVMGVLWFTEIPLQDNFLKILKVVSSACFLTGELRHEYIKNLFDKNNLSMDQLIDKTIHPR